MKRNNYSSFHFRVVIYMMASFNPMQYETSILEYLYNLFSTIIQKFVFFLAEYRIILCFI